MPILLGGPEPVHPLAYFADQIPSCRKGRKTHPSTFYKKARVPDHGILLETVEIGRVLFTTWSAVNEYHEAVTAAKREARAKRGGATGSTPASAQSAPRTPTARRRALARAEAELTAMGL